MIADPAEHIGQPRLWINIVEFGGGDQRIHGGGPFSASIRSAEVLTGATAPTPIDETGERPGGVIL